MRLFLYLSAFILILSCAHDDEKEIDINNLSVPEGFAYLQSKDLSNNQEELLNYVGIRSLGEHKIKLNTNNSHYFFFAAVVDYPMYEKGRYSSSDGKLGSYKRFDGCFIYELCGDTTRKNFVEEQLNVRLMVDNKMSSILNNDSLYFSLNGRNYHTMPEQMSLGSSSPNSFNDIYFDLNSMVPIFSGSVYKPEHKDIDVQSYLLIGLISYDRNKQYDFDAMFHSKEFVHFVGFGHRDVRDNKGSVQLDYSGFRVSDFIVNKS